VPDPSAPRIARHQELSDADVAIASIDDLRAAYISLRAHHIAETSALISRRDDLTRRRDDQLEKSNEALIALDGQLTKSSETLAASQTLIERADVIMRADEETIERLGEENKRLSEIIDFMQNRYSPLGGRGCALCVYDDGRFVRACAMHRWTEAHDAAKRDVYMACDRSHLAPPCEDPSCYCEEHAYVADQIADGLGHLVRAGTIAMGTSITVGDQIIPALHAIRTADPRDPDTEFHLSDSELRAWANQCGLDQPSMEETFLYYIFAELRGRRDAESLFVELDRKLQDVVDCRDCATGGPDGCEDHEGLIRSWRDARSVLCDLARTHHGLMQSRNAPSGGDPR
jgi:hypothetical protein